MSTTLVFNLGFGQTLFFAREFARTNEKLCFIIKDSAVLAEAAGAVPGVNHRSLAAFRLT